MSTEVSGSERLVLRRYLLGQLSPVDQDRVEEQFEDTDYFAVYQSVEGSLVQEYAAGTMAPLEADLFARNYLVTRKRRDRVAIARALSEVYYSRPSIQSGQSLRVPKWIPVLAMAVSVVVGAVVVRHFRPNRPVLTATVRPVKPPAVFTSAPPEEPPPVRKSPPAPAKTAVTPKAAPASTQEIAPPPVPVEPVQGPPAESSPPPLSTRELPRYHPVAPLPALPPAPRPAPASRVPLPATGARPMAGGHAISQAYLGPIGQQMQARYPVTVMDQSGMRVAVPGAILVVQIDGVRAAQTGGESGPYYNEFKNGVIGPDTSILHNVLNTRAFNPRPLLFGEKVYLLKLDLSSDSITFRFQTCGTCDPKSVDPFDHSAQGEVTFKFAKWLQWINFNQVKQVLDQVFKLNDEVQPLTDAPPTYPTSATPQAPPLAAPPPAGVPPPPPSDSVTLKTGMTIDQVVAVAGQPQTIVGDPATKLIYIYRHVKLTFINGKLSDVQ